MQGMGLRRMALAQGLLEPNRNGWPPADRLTTDRPDRGGEPVADRGVPPCSLDAAAPAV